VKSEKLVEIPTEEAEELYGTDAFPFVVIESES
jgi:hypothetical protein